MTSLRIAAALAGSVLAFGAAGVLRAADVCQPMIEAEGKMIFARVHLYSTQTGGVRNGQPISSEIIYMGGPDGPTYVFVRGKWLRSPMTPAELKKARDEKDKSVTMTCRYLRDEAVNGEPAAVYSGHVESPDFQSDTTVWLSKSKNLPLKSATDMNLGGAAGKSHSAIRYDYVNVQAPPGVK
jgi:hypothetical protein